MSLHSVLNSDWSDYDNKKKRGGSDHSQFSCNETWEVDYLVDVIRRQHPEKSRAEIEKAIEACCKQVGLSRQRPAFVECVMKRLGLH